MYGLGNLRISTQEHGCSEVLAFQSRATGPQDSLVVPLRRGGSLVDNASCHHKSVPFHLQTSEVIEDGHLKGCITIPYDRTTALEANGGAREIWKQIQGESWVNA